MNKRQLGRVIEEGLARSTWFESSEIQQNQKAALDSYYARAVPKAFDGLSTARDTSVSDMVEAVVAQIMPAFDFDEVAQFDPDSSDDVDQARHEGLVCNVYLRDRNQGYTVLQEAIRNALLLRNGVCKVYAETQVVSNRTTYQNLSAIEAQAILTPTAPRQQIEIVSSSPAEDGEGADVTIRTTTEFRRLTIEATDTTNFIVSRDFAGHDLQDAPLCGERYFLTASDLRLRGVAPSVIKRLPHSSGDTRLTAGARQPTGDNLPDYTIHGDPSQQRYECFELYVRLDYDGDGVAELRRILYVGGTSGGEVVENDPAERVPYASGTAFLQPNRWLGLSLFDKLCEIEEIKTDALRQYLDNMAYINNNEIIAVDGDVSMQDLKARRPGGIIRAETTDAAQPLVVQDLSAASLNLLNYMDKQRSERGGASLDLQAAELQIAGETAHGIERQYTSKEMLAQLMTRTLAETLVRQVFWLIHETLRRDLPERAEVRVGNQFVQTTPGQWRYRDRINIVAGMSAGERLERRQVLAEVIGQHEKLIQAGFGGGILTDLRTYHSALLDWMAASGIQHGRRYWIDPRSPASVEAQQLQQQQSQQVSAERKALQQLVFRSQMAIEAANNEVDVFKHQTDLQYKVWEKRLESALEELRLDVQFGGDNAEPGDIDRQQSEGPGNGGQQRSSSSGQQQQRRQPQRR